MTAYSLRDAARIFRVSPVRLRAWERAALVRRSAAGEREPVFGFRDLVCLKTILVLLDAGVPLRRIRRSVDAVRARIPELDRPVSALRIWLEGSDRVVVRYDGALYEPSGQQVLDFELAKAEPEDVRPFTPLSGGAASKDPDAALEWFDRGCRLDTQPETREEAIDAYRRALEIDPEFADAHCNLGALHYHGGRLEEARACFERALAGEPGHVEASLNLAELFEEQGRNEAALRHYRVALRSDPLRPEVHLGLALLYDRIGLHRRARQHWRRYLGLAPAGAWAEIARRQLEE